MVSNAGYNNSLLNPLLSSRSVIHQLPTGQRLFHYDHTQLQPNPQFQYNNAALIAPHSPVRHASANPEQAQQELEIGEALLALSPMTSRATSLNNALTGNIPLFDPNNALGNNVNNNRQQQPNNSANTKLI